MVTESHGTPDRPSPRHCLETLKKMPFIRYSKCRLLRQVDLAGTGPPGGPHSASPAAITPNPLMADFFEQTIQSPDRYSKFLCVYSGDRAKHARLQRRGEQCPMS